MFRRYHIFVTLILFFAATSVDARPFRPGQVPNGQVNRCLNCHNTARGGFVENPPDLNPFGLEVGNHVTPNGREAFWSMVAMLDSDGDGKTNGEELGDPEGTWTRGRAPGHRGLVSIPGFSNSRPPRPMQVAHVRAQVDLEQANTPALATTFTAALTGDQENPSVDGDGSGTGAFVLDREGLHYRVTVNGLTGDIRASHFHNAAAGTNGGVVHAISDAFDGNTASGTWPIDPAMIAELVAGNIYVNVHTAAHPGGEVRGQVTLASGVGFWAALDGGQENPPVDGEGSGTGVFVWDGEGLHYWVTVDGLTGDIRAAHFHNAAAGENGGVVRGITDSFDGNTAAGVWTSTDDSPLTSERVGELLAGNLYVNVHTAAHGGGEIRGQVVLTSGVRMVAGLGADQEVHSVTSDGTGTGMFTYDGSSLAYRITVNGLSGEISAAHFHNAAEGEDGDVVRNISFNGTTASGAWPPTGFGQRLTAELLTELISGNIYVNVHTEGNPAGEIRGQVTMTPGVGFMAGLDGGQENPPLDVDGMGTAALNWDSEGLHYWITVDGLTGDGTIRSSHFHNAAAGTNGGVVHAISDDFEGNTAAGVWAIADPMMFGELWAGNLYLNVHTAENRGGEIRGQVRLPTPAAGGMRLAFSRSIAGRSVDFAWGGTTGGSGSATVNIVARGFRYLRVGASGYYVARLTDARGEVLGQWSSIPLRGAREFDLLLPVGGRAAITGPFFGEPLLEVGSKPAVVSQIPTLLTGFEPIAPVVSFGAVQTNKDGTVDLPVQILRAHDLSGGDLSFTYNPDLLTFRGSAIEGKDLVVTHAGPGIVSLSFDGLTSSEQTGLRLTFDPRSTDGVFGSLRLTGLLFNPELMPIAEVDIQARLNGASPADYALFQNQPNPFNPDTQIRYDLPQTGQVRVTIYNALGQEVARLVDARQSAGSYTVTWDAVGFASGLYYYRLEAGAFKEVRKMMLVK